MIFCILDYLNEYRLLNILLKCAHGKKTKPNYSVIILQANHLFEANTHTHTPINENQTQPGDQNPLITLFISARCQWRSLKSKSWAITLREPSGMRYAEIPYLSMECEIKLITTPPSWGVLLLLLSGSRCKIFCILVDIGWLLCNINPHFVFWVLGGGGGVGGGSKQD